MKFKCSIVLILSLNASAFAELAPKTLELLNSEMEKYNQIKAETNPDAITEKEAIAQANSKFLRDIKNKVSKEAYANIEQEINYFQNAAPNEVNKNYLKKITIDPKKQLNRKDKEIFNRLMSSSSAHLEKSYDLKASLASHESKMQNIREPFSKKVLSQTTEKKALKASATNSVDPLTAKSSNKKIVSSSENKEVSSLVSNDASNEQKDIEQAVQNRDANASRFKSQETDSLFEKVTKAYIRSYEKIKAP